METRSLGRHRARAVPGPLHRRAGDTRATVPLRIHLDDREMERRSVCACVSSGYHTVLSVKTSARVLNTCSRACSARP